MKKMKIYVITYKRSEILNDSLDKLFSSDFSKLENTEVNIINNHTDFKLKPEFEKRVNVLHNVLRPDWSNGNVSENYNQAFINGVKNLHKPATELLVTMQNDAAVHSNWCEHLFDMLYAQKFNFVVGHFGDNVVCHTPESIMNIGMWDENLPGQYKEADYWIRALRQNRQGSCINDTLHGLEFNNENALDIDTTEDRNFIEEAGFKGASTLKRRPDDSEQSKIWETSRGGLFKTAAWQYFHNKWKGTWKHDPTKIGWVKQWPKEFKDNPPDITKSKFKTFYRYIYFEKHIPVSGKNYLKIK